MRETGSYSSQLFITVIMLPTPNHQFMKGKMDFDSVFLRCHSMLFGPIQSLRTMLERVKQKEKHSVPIFSSKAYQ